MSEVDAPMTTGEDELEDSTETGHHVTGGSGHEVHHGLSDPGTCSSPSPSPELSR